MAAMMGAGHQLVGMIEVNPSWRFRMAVVLLAVIGVGHQWVQTVVVISLRCRLRLLLSVVRAEMINLPSCLGTGPSCRAHMMAGCSAAVPRRFCPDFARLAVPHRFCLVRMKRRKPSIPGHLEAGPSCRARMVAECSATVPRRFCSDFARLVWSEVMIPHRFCPCPCFSAPAKLRGSVLWKVAVWSGEMIPHRLCPHFPARSQSGTTIPRVTVCVACPSLDQRLLLI